jgi:hypothetical protein
MTTQLRDVLASAADDSTPPDLAGRAMTGARRRRQGRIAAVGSVAAVTALVAGAVVLGPLQQSGDEPRPQDVASLPAELPTPDALPELAAGAMDAASVAYVADDQLVLVDATTGDAASWAGITEVSGLDTGGMDAGALRPYQVRLTPDGSMALVAMRFESSQRLLGTRIAILDVANAEASVGSWLLSDAYAESAWLEYNLMAWAPDSKTAFCVCLGGEGAKPKLGVWSVSVYDGIDPVYSQTTTTLDLVPAQISVGAAGLFMQMEPMGGSWSLLENISDPPEDGFDADALALSSIDGSALALTRDGRYRLESESDLYPQVVSGPLPAGPVSSIQALGDDFVLVSRPSAIPIDEPAPPSPLLAHLLTKGGDPLLVTTFPTGTTSTSFAAEAAVIG